MKRYQPLIVIVLISMLSGLALMALSPQFSFHFWMINFSGFFFLFLSTLKFWDVSGFYHSFKQYDLVTKRFPFYGYLYPFIEFAIAMGYLTHFFVTGVAILTLIVMVSLVAGICFALIKGEKLECACLGAKLDLPLGVVSVVEALLMGAMAVMILIHRL